MGGEVEAIKSSDNGRIPGLTTKTAGLYKLQQKPTLGIFTKGQYIKDGLNGGLIGVNANIPIGKNGNLSLYGGGGNIFQLGGNYSYQVPIVDDKLFFRGSAGFEGTVSATKTQLDTKEKNVSEQHWKGISKDVESHCETESEGSVVWDGVTGSLPDIVDAYSMTEFQSNTTANTNINGVRRIEMPDNKIEAYLEGSLRYNPTSNMYISVGGKVVADSKVAPSSNPEVSHQTELHSSADNPQVSFNTLICSLDGHTTSDPNDFPWNNFEFIYDFDEEYDLNNVNINCNIQDKIALQKPVIKFTPTVGVGFCKNNFEAGIEADLINGVRIGGSYNFSEPISSSSAPDRLYKNFADKKDAQLYLSLEGKSENGINGAALCADVDVPINYSGTEYNAGVKMGNYVGIYTGVTQNVAAGDNIDLNFGVFGEGIVSLTQQENYSISKDADAGKQCVADVSAYSPAPYGDEVHKHYLLNNTAGSQISEDITLSRNNIKVGGSLGATYTSNSGKFSAGVKFKGGAYAEFKPEMQAQNNLNMTANNYSDGHMSFVGAYMMWSPDYELCQIDPITEGSFYTNTTLDVDNNFSIDTKFKPDIKPFAETTVGAEYKFNNFWSLGAEVGKTWIIGGDNNQNTWNFKGVIKGRFN